MRPPRRAWPLPILLLLLAACEDRGPTASVPRPDAAAPALEPQADGAAPAADARADSGTGGGPDTRGGDAGGADQAPGPDGPATLPPTSSNPTALPSRRCASFGLGAVRAVSFTPDGALAVVSDDPATLSLVGPGGGDITRTIDLQQTGAPWAAAFSADGSALLLVSAASEVVVWSHPFERPRRLGVARPGTNLAALSGDGKLAALRSHTGEVELRRVDDGSALRTIGAAGMLPIRGGGLALSPDGAMVAIRADETLALHRTGDGVQLWSVPAPAGFTRVPVVFSPDGRQLAFDQHPPVVVRVADGATVLSLLPQRGVVALAFSGDGKRLLAAGAADTRLWDLATGMASLAWPAGTAAAFTRDGEAVAVAGEELLVRRVASAQVIVRGLDWTGGRLRSLSFSADGRTLLAAHQPAGRSVKQWDLATRRAVRSFPGSWAAAHSADGKHLAMFDEQGPERPVRVLRLADQSWVMGFRGAVHLGFAGSSLVTQERRGPLTLWRIDDQTVVRMMPARDPSVADSSFAISGDATLMAHLDPDRPEAVITRVADGSSVRRIAVAPTGLHGPLAFSASGRLIAIGLEVFRTDDGTAVPALSAAPSQPGALVFSPADDILATTAGGVATLWRPGSAQPASTRLDGTADRLAFSPDGGYLATSSGAAITLWCRD